MGKIEKLKSYSGHYSLAHISIFSYFHIFIFHGSY